MTAALADDDRREAGHSCTVPPRIRTLAHARQILDIHAEHGENCHPFVAALDYVAVCR